MSVAGMVAAIWSWDPERSSVDELLDLATPPEWMAQAACTRHPEVSWFPKKGDGQQTNTAKRICADCPVRVDCLEAALRHDDLHGIWGGLGLSERQVIAQWRRHGDRRPIDRMLPPARKRTNRIEGIRHPDPVWVAQIVAALTGDIRAGSPLTG